MPQTTDQILAALEIAERAANVLVPMVEHASGMGQRWHRWRAFRLRLRASWIEDGVRRRWLAAGPRSTAVMELRRDAASHARMAGDIDTADTLAMGLEPLAVA